MIERSFVCVCACVRACVRAAAEQSSNLRPGLTSTSPHNGLPSAVTGILESGGDQGTVQ